MEHSPIVDNVITHASWMFSTRTKIVCFPREQNALLRIGYDFPGILILNNLKGINNGNRTEWSPIRSVIIRVINKIGRPRSGSRTPAARSSDFVNNEYDYRPNWTPLSQLDNTMSCYLYQ